MSQQFSIGMQVQLVELNNQDDYQMDDYFGRIGKVTTIDIGVQCIRVKWNDSTLNWWYYPRNLTPLSIFYAETDKKGLVI